MHDNSGLGPLDRGALQATLALAEVQQSIASPGLPTVSLDTNLSKTDSKENGHVQKDSKTENHVSLDEKEQPDTVSTVTVKNIEAQLSFDAEPNLPLYKLVPLMFGLCAGMLLSSMDAVSKCSDVMLKVDNAFIDNLIVFDNALPRIIR